MTNFMSINSRHFTNFFSKHLIDLLTDFNGIKFHTGFYAERSENRVPHTLTVQFSLIIFKEFFFSPRSYRIGFIAKQINLTP